MTTEKPATPIEPVSLAEWRADLKRAAKLLSEAAIHVSRAERDAGCGERGAERRAQIADGFWSEIENLRRAIEKEIEPKRRASRGEESL